MRRCAGKAPAEAKGTSCAGVGDGRGSGAEAGPSVVEPERPCESGGFWRPSQRAKSPRLPSCALSQTPARLPRNSRPPAMVACSISHPLSSLSPPFSPAFPFCSSQNTSNPHGVAGPSYRGLPILLLSPHFRFAFTIYPRLECRRQALLPLLDPSCLTNVRTLRAELSLHPPPATFAVSSLLGV